LAIQGFDPNLLLGFFQTKLSAGSLSSAPSAAPANARPSATARDIPPWQLKQPAQSAQDARVLATTNFLDTSKVPLGATTTADGKTEQDNQKLFALYSAVSTLAYLAKIGQREGTTSGQLAGLNTRFQHGLQQVQAFIAKSTFNNFTLQAAAQAPSVTSTAGIEFGSFTYDTRTLVNNANLNNPLPGISASDSFTIAVKKGGVTTNVVVDLSQVPGDLTLGNVVSYANAQLSAAGFSTRFKKVITSGSIDAPAKASYGLQLAPGANEAISLSASATQASLYLAGSTGKATAAGDDAADQQGRLVKLTNLGTTPQTVFSTNIAAKDGTSSALATQVDSGGSVYVIGTTSGDFANQINQGTQDAYLTKYDSAGNVLFSKLLGSAGSASVYALALNPSGGVVVTGSTTADIVPGAVANGNLDSFVARYDSNGNQIFVKQLPTLSTNQANSVSVDAAGNIFIGGQVSGGVIGAGQTAQGGGDAYVAKLDSKGKIIYEKQFGTSGKDQVAATATAADGSLYVASVQNGHAILSKYANGDATVAPAFEIDLGDLQNGGAIGGLKVSGNQVFISGTTQNAALTAGGSAAIGNANSGGADAFVFKLTDQGTSATANFVSYVGTGTTDKGGAVAVGADGTIYLAGSTNGTFAGQTRNVAAVSNQFAAFLAADGSVTRTLQFGGVGGQSAGAGIAIDTQGGSVLDALGLPRGTITLDQSVDLTSQTTLRAGDSFKIQFEGAAARTATITIEKGETLQSLATKINIQLQTKGKASVNFGKGVEGLKIAVNPGVTAKLVAGPADFDALARLGIAPGTLTNGSASTTSNAVKKTFGLGLGKSFDLTTKTGVNLARSQLLGVLSAVQTAYQKTNAPPVPVAGPGIRNGTVSPYLQSQLESANLALNILA